MIDIQVDTIARVESGDARGWLPKFPGSRRYYKGCMGLRRWLTALIVTLRTCVIASIVQVTEVPRFSRLVVSLLAVGKVTIK